MATQIKRVPETNGDTGSRTCNRLIARREFNEKKRKADGSHG